MNISVASFLVGLVVFINVINVYAGDKEDMVKKECHTRVTSNMKRLVKEFGECNREMKNAVKMNSEEHAKRLGCAVKCVMVKESFIDDKGKLTTDLMKAAIEREGIPLVEFQNKVESLFTECKDKFGDKLDPEEEYCKSYMELGSCIHQVLAEFCDEHADKVSW